MASFTQSECVNSQQRMQFETYPLGSTIAQLWQLLTQLPSTNPTPSCQVSSIPMDQIWMLEISLGVYNSGTMTFSSIMSKCLSGYRPKMLKGLIERETERLFTCALVSNSITLFQVVSFQYAVCLLFSTALSKETENIPALEQSVICYIKGQRHREFKQAKLLDAMDPGGLP